MGNADSKNDAAILGTDNLDLSHKKIETLPPDLRKLINLVVLCISNNSLSDIGGLDNKKLQELDASFNKIEKITEKSTVWVAGNSPFFMLKDLRKLNLANNLLREIPISMVNFQNLVELNVSNNKLEALCEQIGLLSSLTILNVSSNSLKALPKEIGQLTSLTKLLVNNNSLSELCPEVGTLTSLNLLNVAENNMQKVTPELGLLTQLSKLYLDNNDLLEFHPRLGNMVSLKELNLRSNQLLDLPSSVANLTNLILLDLTDNPWENKVYNGDDIPALMAFLKAKKDNVNRKRTGTVSKELRRSETRKKLEEVSKTMAQASANTEFVVAVSHKKLYHLKGENRIVVLRVDPIITSLNNGDVFILDTPKKIFVWCGLKSNSREKRKGVHLANLMNAEMGGVSEVVLLDAAKGTGSKADQELFWQELGGKGFISPPDQEDAEAAENLTLQTKLFKFSEDESGRLDIAMVFGEDLYKEMLDSTSCFVLDCGGDVWVWAGLYSAPSEKGWAMLKAEELIGHGKRPEAAEIIWVVDGAETLLFREHFVDWTDDSWEMDEKEKKKKLKEEKKLEKLEKKRGATMLEPHTPPLTPSPSSSPNIMRRQASQSMPPAPLSTPPATPTPSHPTPTPPPSTPTTPPPSASASLPPTPSPTLTVAPPKAAAAADARPSIKDRMKAFDNEAPAPEVPKITVDVAADIERDRERERERLKEREREKIKEKQKNREAGDEKLSEKERKKLEEKEAKEKEAREKEAKEKEEKERREREREKAREREREKLSEKDRKKLEDKEAKEKEAKEKEAREKEEKERLKREKEAKEQEEKERAKAAKAEAKAAKKEEKKEEPKKEEPKKEELKVEEPKVEEPEEEDKPEAAAEGDKKSGKGRRRLPTKNPIRERQARDIIEKEQAKKREEDAKVEAEKAKAAGVVEQPKEAKKENVAGRNAQLGGFGLLYALGADGYLFQKKDELKKTATEASNLQPKDVPRLIHVKGRRNCFVRQVELSYRSLNKGDTFILDCGKGFNTLYQWNGSEANRIEKGKAMDIAKSIKDKERVGARVIIADEGKETDDFWKAIGGKGPIASAASAGDDKEAEQAIRQYIHLFKVVKQPDGKLDLVVVAEGRLLKEMLEQTDCYILDCVSELYVWTGSNSDIKLRNASMKLGTEMMEGREFWTAPVSRELPGSEQILFKERFANWGGSLPITVQQIASGKNTAVSRKQEKVDVLKMHAPKPEKEEVMIDDGHGKVTIWRVEEFTKVDVPEEKHGQFYSGDSYLILYSYVFKNKDCYLIYFWQGRNSTTNEKGASALLTIEQNEVLKGAAKEVRVVQNKEPKHFLTIFKGKIIIHQGKDPDTKKGSSFKKDVAFYHVQGTNEVNTRAIEISVNASSLNSCNSFVVKARNKIFAWYGTHSNNFERNFAKNAFARENYQMVEVNEGSEPADFWTLIGGKETYPPYTLSVRKDARLFACSNATGVFTVEEIHPFVQDDLLNDDVMIIDAFSAAYVWIGPQSTETERKQAMETACEYVQLAPDDRPKDSPIWMLKSGEEPYVFTTHFHGWDYTKRKAPVSFNSCLSSVRDALAQYNRKFTFQELKDKKYPKGIDTSRLEDYLVDDEFETVFEMSLEEFQKQPLWKRQNIKRDLGLY